MRNPTLRQTLMLQCCYPNGGFLGAIKVKMREFKYSTDNMSIGPMLASMMIEYPTKRTHRIYRGDFGDGYRYRCNGKLFKEYPNVDKMKSLRRNPREGVKGWLTRRRVQHTLQIPTHQISRGIPAKVGAMSAGLSYKTITVAAHVKTRTDFVYELTPLGLETLHIGYRLYIDQLLPDLLESVWDQLKNDNYEFIDKLLHPELFKPFITLVADGCTYQEFRDAVTSNLSLIS